MVGARDGIPVGEPLCSKDGIALGDMLTEGLFEGNVDGSFD